MKKYGKLFIGILSFIILTSLITAFAETTESISVVFDRVKLIVNGKMSDTQTLLYNGRTYIQLKGAADAFDAQLEWDGATNVASLTTDTDRRDNQESTSRPSSRTVTIATTGNMYHRDDCRTLSRSEELISLSIEEAIENGYGACGVCKP